ncbi:trypsin-like serine protease [Roseomonas sp. E05]|uniref:trypsin-like serine peptidase n=1 Tax=Roseomonas sp. E05 TaxID=3046310 RepID=UPI0024BA9A81|nr:trypsin-like peptidase domain-containing protein [Roseomonas sp. E05]MDJ0391524.1 trypsin-like serine protease [Roseomonas sp. E05]
MDISGKQNRDKRSRKELKNVAALKQVEWSYFDSPQPSTASGTDQYGWTPLDLEHVSRSYMEETNGGGQVEPVPGFRSRRALTEGLSQGQPDPGRIGLRVLRPEVRFGTDERTEISETASIPWRSICHLMISGPDGRSLNGTGWLAGPDLVVTAGHCVSDARMGGKASQITVVPGSNGAYPPPYGTLDAVGATTLPGWETSQNQNFDVGFIKLPNKNVGQQLGWFGTAVIDDLNALKVIVNLAGYPDDKPLGTMWFNSGRIIKTDAHLFEYLLDTESGQSGSPVFWSGPNGQRIALGVHAYGDGRSNKALRITAEIYGYLQQLRGF